MPGTALLGCKTLCGQRFTDLTKGMLPLAKSYDELQCFLFSGVRDQPAFRVHVETVGNGSAGLFPPMAFDRHGCGRPFADGLPFPLGYGSENVQDQAPGRGEGVDGVLDRNEGGSGAVEKFDQVPEVLDRSGEAVEAEDDQGLRFPTLEDLEGAGQAVAVEILSALPGFLDDLNQVEIGSLGKGDDPGFLVGQGKAGGCLLFRAYPDIADGPNRWLSCHGAVFLRPDSIPAGILLSPILGWMTKSQLRELRKACNEAIPKALQSPVKFRCEKSPVISFW